MSLCPFAGASGYLQNVPERLVVDGFRSWIAGYRQGDLAPWNDAWNLFATTLGPRDGRLALDFLSQWVREIWLWRTDSVLTFPVGSPHICRDECLAAAIVSACQNGEDACLGYCLSRLGGLAGSSAVLETSTVFGDVLQSMGQRLVPVPCEVVRELIERPLRSAYH